MVPISFPGFNGKVKAMVTEHVPEPMFGYDWFRDNGAVLDFANQKLMVNGHYHDLQPKPFSGWVRRIVVERDTQIPNRCECDVKTKVELSELGR